VMELLEANGLQDQVKMVRIGVPDHIITHGDAKLLLAKYGLDTEGIYSTVKRAGSELEQKSAGKRLRAVK